MRRASNGDLSGKISGIEGIQQMRRFMKVFAFLMLGLGLAAAPGYWTYVNFLSASTLTKQLVYGDESSGDGTDAGGDMSVHLAPEMNPVQILGRIDAAQSAGSILSLNVSVWSGDSQIWASTAVVSPAPGAALSLVNFGTLHVSSPGTYIIKGSPRRGNETQFQRIFLEVRRDVIAIRWGLFGVGILMILGAVILYRVADSD